MWKRLTPRTILLLAILLVIWAACSSAGRDEINWWWATRRDKATDYAQYVKSWPNGRHSKEANQRLEDRTWDGATRTNADWAFQAYLDQWPQGKHVSSAMAAIDELHWTSAKAIGTVLSFQQYLEKHPSGPHANEARPQQAHLRTDESPFTTAMQQNTRAALEQFLTQYPGHVNEPDVREALMAFEGEIVHLLKTKQIDVQTEGGGIESVRVKIRSITTHDVVVHVPVGTFFVSHNSSAQNMVTTDEEVVVATNEWTTVSVSVACANRPKDIPSGDDRFEIVASPQQAELQRLMPVLRQESQDSSVRQAAVWIVTDNADYNDLGILVVSPFGFGGSRVIRETQAAHAMRICDMAGIDITKTAVWKDRQKIVDGLKDEELRKWFEWRIRIAEQQRIAQDEAERERVAKQKAEEQRLLAAAAEVKRRLNEQQLREEQARAEERRRIEEQKVQSSREKAAAAKIRIARQFFDMGKVDAAKRWLNDTINQFPDTDAAKIASRILDRISELGPTKR